MAGRVRTPFSNDTFLSVVGILIGISAYVFDHWAIKAILILIALGLMVYAGRRHTSNPLIRYPVAIFAIIAFSSLPWGGIWENFHKKRWHGILCRYGVSDADCFLLGEKYWAKRSG
jgi:hypothetical protein